MRDVTRIAIYYAPPAGTAFERFGASWLGWSAAQAVAVPHPPVPGLPVPVEDITATPRKYGFHGTLKPPFRLVADVGSAEVSAAAAGLAATIAPFEAPPLALRALGRFIALVPSVNCPRLADLAGRTVEALEPFRAPPDAAELARRRRTRLSPRQEANLLRWGYPYVMDEFRFHLTLTGALDREIRESVLAALDRPTRRFRSAPLPVREFCLFGEADDGYFRLLERHPLTG